MLEVGDAGEEVSERIADSEDGHGGLEVCGADVAA